MLESNMATNEHAPEDEVKPDLEVAYIEVLQRRVEEVFANLAAIEPLALPTTRALVVAKAKEMLRAFIPMTFFERNAQTEEAYQIVIRQRGLPEDHDSGILFGAIDDRRIPIMRNNPTIAFTELRIINLEDILRMYIHQTPNISDYEWPYSDESERALNEAIEAQQQTIDVMNQFNEDDQTNLAFQVLHILEEAKENIPSIGGSISLSAKGVETKPGAVWEAAQIAEWQDTADRFIKAFERIFSVPEN